MIFQIVYVFHLRKFYECRHRWPTFDCSGLIQWILVSSAGVSASRMFICFWLHDEISSSLGALENCVSLPFPPCSLVSVHGCTWVYCVLHASSSIFSTAGSYFKNCFLFLQDHRSTLH